MKKSRAVGAAHLTCLPFADSTPPQDFYVLSLNYYRSSFPALPDDKMEVL